MNRTTDDQLQQMAQRLRLTFTRDHLVELIEEVNKTQMTIREALVYIFGKEISRREANRIRLARMGAHFPWNNSDAALQLPQLPTGLAPGVWRELQSMEWIAAGENLAVFGKAGTGKTFLLTLLGELAIRRGYSVRYYQSAVLLGALEKAQKEGTLETKLKAVNKPQLLIIDELGYLPISLEDEQRLFVLISKRYGKKSIAIACNQKPSVWENNFPDDTMATTILDRLLYRSTIVTLTGDSFRLQEQQRKLLGITALTAKEQLPTA